VETKLYFALKALNHDALPPDWVSSSNGMSNKAVIAKGKTWFRQNLDVFTRLAGLGKKLG
jgi:hypothetical protein